NKFTMCFIQLRIKYKNQCILNVTELYNINIIMLQHKYGGVFQMKILKYLIKNYGSDEPIFLDDLRGEMNIKDSNLRQYLKRLVDSGQLKRYEKGIYYIPKTGSILKNKPLSFNKVVKKKYLYDGNKIIGYQSGITFANDLNLTTQTARVPELVTNKETNRKRKVRINNRYV